MYMNLKMWAIGESAFVSIFVNKGPKRCFYLVVPKVPKNIDDGPINQYGSFKKKKKRNEEIKTLPN
jgi:hypothetical protein